MSFPGSDYAPPGPYTRTLFDNPLAGALASLRIPIFIGEGNEFLSQRNLEVARGSSSVVDQQIINEDATGRAVVSVSDTLVVTLGSFDGDLDRIQVRNYPIVSGNGTGITTNNRTDVSVTIDGLPMVVAGVDGTNGIVKLAQAMKNTDDVKVSYFFNRTDTLFTDDLSDQVTEEPAILRAAQGIADVNAQNAGTEVLDIFVETDSAPGNNVLLLTVDGSTAQIDLPQKSNYTMAQVAAAITAEGIGTLTASTFDDNFGNSTLSLSADHDITIGSGSANAPLGLISGETTTRTKTFYAFHGPIVDGSNGGVTTTDPSHVTFKVNGLQIIPTALSGSDRAITVAQSPKSGVTVTVTYWANTWQDTFDHLAHNGVTSITSVGIVPDQSDYINEADYVLHDDKIHWGTSVMVESGSTTTGSEFFDDTQVKTTLIDNKTFLSPCSAVVTTSGGVSETSSTDFTLPLSPTLGNGRDTKLGTSLFQSASNGRIDVPVNRPDVIDAYWGFGEQDALTKGKVAVTHVEGNVITLSEKVPVGASVYASFWYNQLTDNVFTLAAVLAGQSGTGTYTATDLGGSDMYFPKYSSGSKGASLTGVTVEFPSGSELTPDLRFESGSGDNFTGPVEEIVTVEFATKTATPAKFTVVGADEYAFISGQSDKAAWLLDGNAPAGGIGGTAGMDLDNPTNAGGGGMHASILGGEIEYVGGTGGTAGQNTTLVSTQEMNITMDGTAIPVKVGSDQAATQATAVTFADAINEAANGFSGVAAGGGASTVTLNAAQPGLGINNYFVGWKVVVGTSFAGTNGDVQTVTSYDGATGIATVGSAWAGGVMAAADVYRIYNPATMAEFKTATKFNGATVIAGGAFDELKFDYVGHDGTASDQHTDTITIAPATYATAADLATAVETALNASAVVAIGVTPDLAGLAYEVEADGDGRLVFKVQLPGIHKYGYLTFLDGAAVADDFAVLAGIDTGATTGAGQAVLNLGEVARAYTTPGGGTRLHDRLILRNRLAPGGGVVGSHSMDPTSVESDSGLEIGAASGNDTVGLTSGMVGEAGRSATVIPASLVGEVGFAGGQTTGWPTVTFYDGTGSKAKNVTLDFTLDGVPVAFDFTNASGAAVVAAGSAVPIGPIGTANTASNQIAAAIAAVTSYANAAAVVAAGVVRLEGAGIFIGSVTSGVTSGVTVNSGTANGVMGLVDGTTVTRSLVSAYRLASALMANMNTSFAAMYIGTHTSNRYWSLATSYTTDFFADQAMAGVVEDASGNDFLYLQSLTLGTSSSVTMKDGVVAGLAAFSWLAQGTGLLSEDLDGAVGEAAIEGYFVVSSNPGGSGSVDSSLLNNGTGQDGILGQTYRDAVTGLTFTILPRGFKDNEAGPWVAYPTGSAATLLLNVTKTFITDANIPHNAMPGIELTVANTSGVSPGDTALVQTFERGGEEPGIGDIYYATYVFQKEDLTTGFYTKLSAIENSYGEISVNNPVSLASYLAILNGAVLVGVKQVAREEGQIQASLATYRDAIAEMEGALPGQIRPDIITPLRGDSTDLYQILKLSNNKMSSIRYKRERTSIIGMSAGSDGNDAKALAQNLSSDRMRLVYPDIAIIRTSDAFGNSREDLVDGPMLAAGLTGSVVSPNVDVATPWTRRKLVGYVELARKLDPVEQNQIAQKGVTVLEDSSPFLRVRHGLTTDMSNILRKTPTIALIADEVQKQSRAVLEQFIGVKFLPGILSQIEGRLAMMFKALVQQQIVAQYQGIKAVPDIEDPTVANVEAYYAPIFPLLYIVVSYHLRSSL